MYTIHHLNLGSPDNLVFVCFIKNYFIWLKVIEYIEHLRDKIVRNECIYCEKVFADRITLMDHMRKKNHKEVNPKNNYYDKVFDLLYFSDLFNFLFSFILSIIWNLVSVGLMFWLKTLKFFKSFKLKMTTFQQDNTDEDLLGLCLFCDHANDQLDEIVNHMKDDHKFDIFAYISEQGMELYDRMKFVNFIRKQVFF